MKVVHKVGKVLGLFFLLESNQELPVTMNTRSSSFKHHGGMGRSFSRNRFRAARKWAKESVKREAFHLAELF